MKKSTIAKLLIIGTACAGFSSAFAASTGQIEFKGDITADVCGIKGGSNNQTVQLGSVSAKVLDAVGKQSTGTDFTIELQDCSSSTLNGATVKFTGVEDADAAGLLKIADGAGAAKGVGILVTDANGKPYSIGTAGEKITLTEGGNVLKFKAAYQATKADVKDGNGKVTAPGVVPGKANGTAMFTVDYD
ncbi:fimbrial protein [Paraherbaspirillum soli]|uniref:Fimbrial protein n=1 Tax=Paraherbaspirillum soli TaxID=631222 RepID=A0ABW0MBZ0_9BURK